MGVPGSANLMLFGGAQAYEIDQSLRFNSADSAYLNRTPASAGNRRTYTISMWVKRGKLGQSSRLFGSYTGPNSYFEAFFTSSDTLQWYYWNGTGYSYNRNSTQVFRDASAWYHLVFVFNSPSGTASQRMRIYVNNQEITSFSASTDPSSNFDCLWNSTSNNVIGDLLYVGSPGYGFDGYMAEIHAIDGSVLDPSSFGETDPDTGAWIPKRYAGSYGTNGFYLTFADNSNTTATTLGKDYSGNGNNWTPNAFSVTAGAGNDVLSDTPTTNWCTLNPIIANTGYLIPATNGNLEVSVAAGSNLFVGAAGTQAITAGKFYWEITPTAISTSAGTWMEVGIIQTLAIYPNATSIGAFNGGFAYTNNAYKARSGSYSAYGATWTTNDVIGVALDADSGSITFYKNGVSQGAAYTDLLNYNLPAGYYPAIAIYRNTGTTQSAVFNFGQRAFAYTPPTGYKALNTANLPEPSIKKPSSYMDVVAYSGAASNQSITLLGFQPDFLWIKRRNSTNSHVLQDAVRGAGKTLFSNATNAESGNTSDLISSFDANGFTVNDTYLGGSGGGATNASGGTYAAWCWDAGGAGSSNNAGTITSTVSANPSAGFSIVTYTGNGTNGATVGHDLGVKPDMVIIKKRVNNTATNTGTWIVQHKQTTAGVNANASTFTLTSYTNGALYLNLTNALSSYGFDNQVNGNTDTFVAYCFSEVAGYSKFGSYTGNGSSDGPFVHTGFKIRFLLLKKATTGVANGNWYLLDATRNEYNPVDKYILPNSSAAEGTTTAHIDFLSNGFKVRTTNTDYNESGQTYIFAAFAEMSFGGQNVPPATAR
jgi:hypothetical protein